MCPPLIESSAILFAFTELSASSLEPTAPALMCLASIWSVAIFAELTWLAAICIVSILPDAISELSIEFSAMCVTSITPVPIFAAVIELLPKCMVSILPVTNSDESTEFAAR